ncbi:MAG: peroxiredoxin [Nocardioidaceae bacterium]
MSLEIGQPAPEFTLKNQYGQDISLSDFRGHKTVVLVFYPFAFSRVCTGELREIRDHVTDFSDDGTVLLAVSCDHMFSLRAFAERDGYEFSLLSDYWPHGGVSSAYEIFNEKVGCSGRATFVIDQVGRLRWMVENEIPDARNLDDYRAVLAQLG